MKRICAAYMPRKYDSLGNYTYDKESADQVHIIAIFPHPKGSNPDALFITSSGRLCCDDISCFFYCTEEED